MNLNIILIIFTVVIILLVVIILVIVSRLKASGNNDLGNFIKSDLIEVSHRLNELNSALSDKIDHNNYAMQQSIQRQLSESTKIVSDVSNRLTKLDDTNNRVINVADELKTLQNVLQNPKQRGVLGEYYLKMALDNVLSPSQYKTQYKFKNGEAVDAVIFLDGNKILPIDSKFSLENYNRMIEAKDNVQKEQYANKVKNDLKGRIDETSKYIRPLENTMDFAFMFIPSEALYYDMLIGRVGSNGSVRDLIEYAYRDKKVIIVGPTTFMAYLQTILEGLKSLKIDRETKIIQDKITKLGVHITNFSTYLNKLGDDLDSAVGHYNNTFKELSKFDNDVSKISNTDIIVDEAKQVEKPNRE